MTLDHAPIIKQLTTSTKEANRLSIRYFSIDFFRGIGIGLMLIYHLSFGLQQAGVLSIDFSHDWFWLGFRCLIVSIFLTLVGVSLVLSHRTKIRFLPYSRRLLLLLLCAGSISWSSYRFFPDSYIFFGILHLIFLSSLLGLLFLRFYYLNLFFAAICLYLGNNYFSVFFDQPIFQWLGMVSVKPLSQDYAPLFPWFGLLLVGMFLGQFACKNNNARSFLQWKTSRRWLHWIAWAGNHSLAIYVIHFQLFYVVVFFLR